MPPRCSPVVISKDPKRQPRRPENHAFRKPIVSREIVIPVTTQDYLDAIADNERFRALLADCYARHPECFPPEFENGFGFKDFKYSSKLQLSIRRIRVGFGSEERFYRVVPCDVMPYMVARVEEVEKALFLRKFNIPFWGLAYTFGRSASFYWRLERRLGTTSIAGALAGKTEVACTDHHRPGSAMDSDPDGGDCGDCSACSAGALPEDLVCDEKHAKYLGEKAYVAVSAGGGCVIGAELTEGADKDSLVAGYGVLKEEMARAAPGHTIKSVNTDGYASTTAAMRELWGNSVLLITCILHLFIALRDGCKRKYREQFEAVADGFWWCYEAESKRSFAQRWRAFMETCIPSADWLPERIVGKLMRANTRKLASYKAWYERPQAHRVSVEVDRVMGSLDRRLFAMRHLRGHFVNSRLLLRAWAHLYNFAPWNPYTARQNGARCPAEQLMKLRYRDNWLENFRVASSLAGYRHSPKTP